MKNPDNLASELITFKNSQGLKASGTILKLSRNYTVFEIYNPYSIVQLSEVLQEVKIFRARTNIYDGKATIANIVNTGVVLIVTATLSDSSWKDVFDVFSKEHVEKEIGYLINNFEQQQEIDSEFKMSILNLKAFLLDARKWLDKLEPSLEGSSVEVSSEFIKGNFISLITKIRSLYNECTNMMIGKIAKEKIILYKDFIHENLHPLLMSSPFPYRAFSKPLGFAGDYMMMYMIQHETAKGPNLYSKFVNVFYSNIPLSVSVSNRTSKLLQLINEGVQNAENKNEKFSAFSIGCGPALEVKKFIRDQKPKVPCNFRLLDFNQETLNFAKSEADKVNNDNVCKVDTVLESVHNLLKLTTSRGSIYDEKYNFVYCSGLFDYLSDKICSRLTKMFYSWLKPGGKLLVTNMHSKDRDRYLTEIVLEWYLIYRDEKNMANFAPGLGKQELYTDFTGVNLCLEITKI